MSQNYCNDFREMWRKVWQQIPQHRGHGGGTVQQCGKRVR